MVLKHSIKINGKWYKAGEEITSANIVSNKKESCYSKSEINRMPVAELRILAKKEEIEGFGEKTGAELKKLLIQKYEL